MLLQEPEENIDQNDRIFLVEPLLAYLANAGRGLAPVAGVPAPLSAYSRNAA